MNRSLATLFITILTLTVASTAVAAGGGYITGDMSSTVVVRPFSTPLVYAAPAPYVPSVPACGPCATPTITNYRPVVVAPHLVATQPTVTYRPAYVGQPVYVAPRRATYYAPAYSPVVAGPRYVTAYSPVIAPAPRVYRRPVVVRTNVYVPWQPIRNTARWLGP